MRLPRFIHKQYAKMNGYFWLPCPLCGMWTGGHEWNNPRAVIYCGHGHGRGTCDGCAERAWAMSRPVYAEEGVVAMCEADGVWRYVTDDPELIAKHRKEHGLQ